MNCYMLPYRSDYIFTSYRGYSTSTYLGVLPDGIVVTLEVVIIRDVFPYLTVLDRIEGTTRNTFKV